MNVLLSIKPNYVEKIISGEKTYEFRKSTFKNVDNIDRIYIYSTSPVKKIIGSFKIGDIVSKSPRLVWEQCNEFSGMNKQDFFDYFKQSNKAVAISIEDLHIFNEPVDPYVEFKNFRAPQSFCYFKENSLVLPTRVPRAKLSTFS